jgi:signal transduction histidine kinase
LVDDRRDDDCRNEVERLRLRIAGLEAMAIERETLEHQLRQAQKMEGIGRVTGGIAHDFNNLLTVMLANIALIEGQLPPSADGIRGDLEALTSAAHRGAELVRKLLSFSRREHLNMQPLKLASVVEDWVPALRRMLPETIQLTAELGDDGTVILGDRGAIEQILLNLATNARDAMSGGGFLRFGSERVYLNERYRESHPWAVVGPYVALSVSDTGIGMDKDTLQHALEPFFTTKPVGVGTGLGLSMVYGLMKQHGGLVQLYSEPFRGTVVRLYFPVHEGAVVAQAPALTATSLEALKGSETILLVEDEPAIRSAGRRLLATQGYQVLTAEDGVSALRILAERGSEVHLIVTDVVMPLLGGPELLKAVRSMGYATDFLFTSGYVGRDLHETGELPPEEAFLRKPWTVEEFLGAVRGVLDRTKQGDQAPPQA